MARDDDETPWARQLLVGLAALIVAALLIAGVLSAFALGAARVSGLDDSRTTTTAKPSLVIPSEKPTTDVQTRPGPSGEAGSGTPVASPTTTPSKKEKKQKISLLVLPAQVAPGQRINLTGTYRGGDGARLQVQRFENGWTDFPVTTTVKDGQFITYITTTRTGDTRLRVLDEATGKASNEVRVSIG